MLRQDERRGMKFLLPALAEIADRPDVEIVLFGHATVPADAPRFRHAHLGTLQRDAVPKLLSTVHVVIDPSLFQGFGLIGLEGMASGAACVLTDSGGVSEYAVHDVNALLVPPRDSGALAAAIRRLLDDPALRERLAANGVETARRFTWKLTATRFRAFMDGLPPARAVPPGERAALELLAFEHRTRTELVAERHELGKTLSAIAGSRVWKAAQLARRVLAHAPGKGALAAVTSWGTRCHRSTRRRSVRRSAFREDAARRRVHGPRVPRRAPEAGAHVFRRLPGAAGDVRRERERAEVGERRECDGRGRRVEEKDAVLERCRNGSGGRLRRRSRRESVERAKAARAEMRLEVAALGRREPGRGSRLEPGALVVPVDDARGPDAQQAAAGLPQPPLPVVLLEVEGVVLVEEAHALESPRA